MKFEKDDYIGHATFYAKFLVFVRLAGACPHIGTVVISGVYSVYSLFFTFFDIFHLLRFCSPVQCTDSIVRCTGRRQHLSNAVLKLFYLTGASLNICK